MISGSLGECGRARCSGADAEWSQSCLVDDMDTRCHRYITLYMFVYIYIYIHVNVIKCVHTETPPHEHHHDVIGSMQVRWLLENSVTIAAAKPSKKARLLTSRLESVQGAMHSGSWLLSCSHLLQLKGMEILLRTTVGKECASQRFTSSGTTINPELFTVLFCNYGPSIVNNKG